MIKRLLLLFVAAVLFAAVGCARGEPEGEDSAVDASEGVRVGDYIEHPVLAAMVEEGLIPPIEDRLPVPGDIAIVQPLPSMNGVEEARYGGTAYIANDRTPGTPMNAMRFTGGQVGNFSVSTGGELGQPEVLKEYDVNEDFTQWRFYLRRGLKWSDGVELKAWEFYDQWVYDLVDPLYSPDVIQDNVTVTSDSVTIENFDTATGRSVTYRVIDDYTFEVTCDVPWPTLINDMSHMHYTERFVVYPMHFAKQFHASVIGEEEAEAQAEEFGFESWQALYSHFAYPHVQSSWQARGAIFPPVLAPYQLVEKTETGLIYERNPFYWKVDTNGRQLPYIDRLVVEHVSDSEMAFGKLLSGEIDTQIVSPSNLPVFSESVTARDYQIVPKQASIWAALLHVDYMYNDPVVRELFRTKEFRIALSVAIDREKQNELVFGGTGVPSQFTAAPAMPYHKEEYMYMHSEYDPQKAMRLLDELGVTDQNGDGWRENADGEKIFFTIDYLSGRQDRVDTAELTMEDWKAIGLNVGIQGYDASLFWPTRGDGQQAIHLWEGGQNGPVLFPAGRGKFVPSALVGNTAENAWSQYYQTGEGPDVPPPEALEANEAYATLVTASSAAEQAQAADTILRLQAEEVWNIGVVGLVSQFEAFHNDLGGVWTEADGAPVTVGWDYWTVKPWNGEHHYFKTRPILTYEQSLLKNWYPMDQWADPLELSRRENWF